MADDVELRRRSDDEAEAFFARSATGRRRRQPSLEDIEASDLPGRLVVEGERSRLAGVRVVSPTWRWPWPALDRADIVDCDLEGVRIERGLLRGSSVRDCTFERVVIGGQVGGTEFTGTTFRSVRLAGVATTSIDGATFRTCTFVDLRAPGTQISNTTFEDCTFDGLRGSTSFRDCTFRRTTFRGTLRNVVLERCRLEAVDLADARIAGVFIDRTRHERDVRYPTDRGGFVVPYPAYRAVIEATDRELGAADAALAAEEARGWLADPPADIVVDRATFAELSAAGRERIVDALYERRLVHRV